LLLLLLLVLVDVLVEVLVAVAALVAMVAMEGFIDLVRNERSAIAAAELVDIMAMQL